MKRTTVSALEAPDEPEGEPVRPRRRSKTPPMDAFMIRVAKLALWCFFIGVGVVTLGLAWLSTLAAGLPEIAGIDTQPRRPSIVVLDRYGREVARRGPLAAPDVAVADLPPYLIAAVLAVEDRRFYEHSGVDVRGLARAAVENLRAGRIVQGGSTLTQQLAKNLFLDNERTLDRKLREMVLAAHLERTYSKDEILELYLNRVYFGAGAWGVQAAAERYFDKPAADVTLGEAVILAGLLKAPSRYNPLNDVDLAAERATVVLEVMAETGAITAAELDAALSEPVHVRASPAANRGGGWFVDWAIAQAQELVADDARDLVIHTTLDLDAQTAASAAVTNGLAGLEDRGAEQAALVALEGDGAVRAMIGGRSYAESEFNRALEARRQPGSAFKPFVYAAAIEAGLSPWTVRSDAPITVEGWSPTNFDEEFDGDIALIDAMARSVNTTAVRVAEEIGRERIVRLVKRLGVTSRIRATASMALGSHEVRPIDLTAAYATFANGGYVVEPYAIVRIETPDGEALWRRSEPPPMIGLEPRTYRLINTMLARVVTDGTGRSAALPGRPAAGKTGTTNDFRDAWFIGYVPGFVAGVWVGADDFSPMERVTGGAVPTRIWHDFMAAALEGQPVEPLELESEPPAGAATTDAVLAPLAEASPRSPAITAEDRRELDALLEQVDGL